MTVHEWMAIDPATVGPETSVREARQLMRAKGIRHLPVIEDEYLVGMLSDRDVRIDDRLLRGLETLERLGEVVGERTSVGTVMAKSVHTITPDSSLGDAARLMLSRQVSALPVVDDDYRLSESSPPPTVCSSPCPTTRTSSPAKTESRKRKRSITMERWICARKTVVGRPDELTDTLVKELPALLQNATGVPASPPEGDGGVHLRLSTGTGDRAIHKDVHARIGEHEDGSGWVSIPLEWTASSTGSLFPSFRGRVEIEPTSAQTATVMLIGSYHPPLGPLGAAADTLILNRTARRTGQWLVDLLAASLVEHAQADTVVSDHPHAQLTVGDIMTVDPITFPADQSLRAAAEVLLRHGISGAPVVDSAGRVVGVLSERDLLDKAAEPPRGIGRDDRRARERHNGLLVGDVCTRPARTTAADTSVRQAAEEMASHDVDRLVVLDGGRHVGILTRTDVLKVLIRAQDELEEAVREVLGTVDADEVDMVVREGVVTLTGEIELRSNLRVISSRLAAIDGVIDVQADLSWRTDDVLPPTIPIMMG